MIEETANRFFPVPTEPFSCQGRPYGFYADIPTNCRDFHICQPYSSSTNGQNDTWQHSTLSCPRYTVFNQMSMTCTREEELPLPCRQQMRLYDINLQLSGTKPRTTVAPIEEVSSFSSSMNLVNKNVTMMAASHYEGRDSLYNARHIPARIFTNGHHLILKPVVYPGQPINLLRGMIAPSSHVMGSMISGPVNYVYSDIPASSVASASTMESIPSTDTSVRTGAEEENPVIEITNSEENPTEEVAVSPSSEVASTSSALAQTEPPSPRVIPESPMARARRTHLQ